MIEGEYEMDWEAIRNEYISTETSYRKLAEKYALSVDTIKRRGAAELWAAERAKIAPEIHRKTVRKVVERMADMEADRIGRILSIADKLVDQLEVAAAELNRMTVKNRHKVRNVEYNNPVSTGKTIKEVIDETEEIQIISALIDRQGLQQLTAALKNLRDVMQDNKEQETGELVVTFEGSTREYAE